MISRTQFLRVVLEGRRWILIIPVLPHLVLCCVYSLTDWEVGLSGILLILPSTPLSSVHYLKLGGPLSQIKTSPKILQIVTIISIYTLVNGQKKLMGPFC